MKQIRTATVKDPELQDLARLIHTRWSGAPSRAYKEYKHARDELVIVKGVIYKGLRVIIPKSMPKNY